MKARAWIAGVTLVAAVAASASFDKREQLTNKPKKLELQHGFYVEVPKESNSTGKLLSFGVDLNKDNEGRSKQKKLLQRILPMFIMPFLIQSSIIPMFLGMLKFMLFKSLMVGKLALSLILINAFKNHNSHKGRTTRQAEMADVHYGYHMDGMEEYGAYFN